MLKYLFFAFWFIIENTFISVLMNYVITKSFNWTFAIIIFAFSVIMVLPFAHLQSIRNMYRVGIKFTGATAATVMYISAVIRFTQLAADYPEANKLPVLFVVGLLGLVIASIVFQNIREAYRLLRIETSKP